MKYTPLPLPEDTERWTHSWYTDINAPDKCMCETCRPYNINPVDLTTRRLRASATWKWWQWWK